MRKYIPLLVVISIVSVTLVFLLKKGTHKVNIANSPQKSSTETIQKKEGEGFLIESDQKTVEVQTSYYEIKKGTESTFEFSFLKLPDPVPAAISLVVNYDPTEIEIKKVEPGNLWGKTNELKTEINNSDGILKYSIGQGFGSEATSNSQIAKLTILLKKEQGQTSLKISDESVMAFVGVNRLINFNSNDVMIIAK